MISSCPRTFRMYLRLLVLQRWWKSFSRSQWVGREGWRTWRTQPRRRTSGREMTKSRYSSVRVDCDLVTVKCMVFNMRYSSPLLFNAFNSDFLLWSWSVLSYYCPWFWRGSTWQFLLDHQWWHYHRLSTWLRPVGVTSSIPPYKFKLPSPLHVFNDIKATQPVISYIVGCKYHVEIGKWPNFVWGCSQRAFGVFDGRDRKLEIYCKIWRALRRHLLRTMEW